MIRNFTLIALSTILLISCSGNGNPGKDLGVNGKKDSGMIEEVARDTFQSTGIMYPEYDNFEIDEKGYDPCELLSMQAITLTCNPTSAVNIFNQKVKGEKVCVYSWNGTDGKICQVRFAVLAYSLKEAELKALFKTDKDGTFNNSDYGVRWVKSNKVYSVSYVGELIKKVNIRTIMQHVKPIK